MKKEMLTRQQRCYLRHVHPDVLRVYDAIRQKFAANHPDRLKALLKGGHQYCFPNTKLEAAEAMLAKQIDELLAIGDFERLLGRCNRLLAEAGVKTLPSLSSYDLALRIGYCREPQVLPRDKTYHFRGAYEGMKLVTGRSRGLGYCTDTEKLRTLFPNMSPMEIESFLCICKGCIKDGTCNLPRCKTCIKRNDNMLNQNIN